MKTSNLLMPTLRDIPNDAEIISHQLMLRAGLIRQVAAGIYTWLPLGLRVLRKVENIVREEMDKAGAQELLMSGVQPAELWKESKRYEEYGPELLRFKDRHKRDFCLGPTHEEIITALVRNEIKSYKQLPANFYQIQTKFRDEIRPRFGIMRAREFLMKDAYSFHLDEKSLSETYDVMHRTYSSIFDRIGLKYKPVLADTGNIGGSTSHEFHVLAESGEDSIAYNDSGTFAANLEMVPLAVNNQQTSAAPSVTMDEIETPNQNTMEEVSKFLQIPMSEGFKTLIVEAKNSLIAIGLRGDHELNLVKAQSLPEVANPLKMAKAEDIQRSIGCAPGSIGPRDLQIPLIIDQDAANLRNFFCGANKDGYHLTGVNWRRDLPMPKIADLRNAVAGDPSPDGDGTLKIQKGIEVGHIFQLGSKYSEAMGAKVLNADGKESNLIMGCYGIGVSRIIAAAIEQNYDENGIVWPTAVAPFSCAVVPINMKKSSSVEKQAKLIYEQLTKARFDTLFCDDNKRPGVIFSDIDLIGIPIRIVISEKNLKKEIVEVKMRQSNETLDISLERLLDFISTRLNDEGADA